MVGLRPQLVTIAAHWVFAAPAHWVNAPRAFGQMVNFRNNAVGSVSLDVAVKDYNYVNKDSDIVKFSLLSKRFEFQGIS